MKSYGIFFLGIMVSFTMLGCGQERGAKPTGGQGAVAPSSANGAQPGVEEASAEASWQDVNDGTARFLARLAELDRGVTGDITEKANEFELNKNCIQVIRPLQAQGDAVGSVEFLPEACPEGPILVGRKQPAFVLTIKQSAEVEPAAAIAPPVVEPIAEAEVEGEERATEPSEQADAQRAAEGAPVPLQGNYALFYSDEESGEVEVGTIRFNGEEATITALCAGDAETAVCRVETREARFHRLVINSETMERVAQEQREAELGAHERARKAVEEARASLADAERRLGSVNELITAAENEATEEVDAGQKELAKLREELTVQTEQVRTARENVRKLQDENRKLTATAQEREAHVADNERMLQDALNALERANQQLQSAQKQVNRAQSEIQGADAASNSADATSDSEEDGERTRNVEETPSQDGVNELTPAVDEVDEPQADDAAPVEGAAQRPQL